LPACNHQSGGARFFDDALRRRVDRVRVKRKRACRRLPRVSMTMRTRFRSATPRSRWKRLSFVAGAVASQFA
jgi:hypothetical protein